MESSATQPTTKRKRSKKFDELPPDPSFNLLLAIAAWKRDVQWDEATMRPLKYLAYEAFKRAPIHEPQAPRLKTGTTWSPSNESAFKPPLNPSNGFARAKNEESVRTA